MLEYFLQAPRVDSTGGSIVAAVLKEDDQMEGQLGRLESDVSFIRSDFGEMKLDLRALATTVADQRAEMHRGFTSAQVAIADVRLALQKSHASLREAIVAGDAKSAEALAEFRQEVERSHASLREAIVVGDAKSAEALADFRQEVERSHASLREAIVAGDAKSAEALVEFRQETGAAFADLRVEMLKGDSALRHEIQKLALSQYIQIVSLGIGFLTLIARAFKWI
jgi:hypothetical protein